MIFGEPRWPSLRQRKIPDCSAPHRLIHVEMHHLTACSALVRMIASCWTECERTGSMPPCLLLVQAMDGVHPEPPGFGDTRSRPMRWRIGTCVSKGIILLVQAARESPARPPTMQRMVGSTHIRSASLVSSYPVRRLYTNCRSSAVIECRVFLPIR